MAAVNPWTRIADDDFCEHAKDIRAIAGAVLDLALTPTGPKENGHDGSDGSANWLQISENLEWAGGPDEICGNGEDDDGDGLADCDDSDCEAEEACQVVKGPLFHRGDPDDNGAIQLTDGIFILNFLFLGGTPPPAPGLDCGEDPEDPNDELGCETFNGCG